MNSIVTSQSSLPAYRPNLLLVGKTNVGKSSLFNALIRQRLSVVDQTENLTNDLVKFDTGKSLIFDSPGIKDISELDYIASKMQQRLDTVAIVIDPQTDYIDFCTKIIAYFKGKECILIVNKIDTNQSFNFTLSGVETFYVSALYGLNLEKLRRRLHIEIDPMSTKNISWSIFGRSNVGKSALANALLNRDRFRVLDSIGTTREINCESLDVAAGSTIDIIDTPGYRKSNSIDYLAKASQYRLEDYINNEIKFRLALVVIDASVGLLATDRHIIDKVLDHFIIIIVLNKIDLVSNTQRDSILSEVRRMYRNMMYVCISSTERSGLKPLFRNMQEIEKFLDLKITTSSLNKWLRSHDHLTYIKYMTRTDLLDFILFSKRKLIKSEVKFLENSLCSYFNIRGTRVRFNIVVQ